METIDPGLHQLQGSLTQSADLFVRVEVRSAQLQVDLDRFRESLERIEAKNPLRAAFLPQVDRHRNKRTPTINAALGNIPEDEKCLVDHCNENVDVRRACR